MILIVPIHYRCVDRLLDHDVVPILSLFSIVSISICSFSATRAFRKKYHYTITKSFKAFLTHANKSSKIFHFRIFQKIRWLISKLVGKHFNFHMPLYKHRIKTRTTGVKPEIPGDANSPRQKSRQNRYEVEFRIA
jgi:hypothetical protein